MTDMPELYYSPSSRTIYRDSNELVWFAGMPETLPADSVRLVLETTTVPALATASNPGNVPRVELDAMRYETVGNVDFEPTDDQLRRVWRENPDIVALAAQWSWGDTEVREQLCAALEAIGPESR